MQMEDAAFTTVQMAEKTGFSVKQLNYWAKIGMIIPSIQLSGGSGHRKLYGIDNFVELRFIQHLKKFGWSTQKIRQAVETLKEVMNDPNPLRRAILLNTHATIFALCKTKEGERIMLDALSVGGQQVMGIVLEMLIEEALEIASIETKTLVEPPKW
jgi:DNA-binding transcriptional MerR regulator